MNQARRQIKTLEQQVPTVRSCEVAVRFGRMSMDCRNFGFCRIEPVSEGKDFLNSKIVFATMCFLNGKLLFEFDRNILTEAVYEKYMRSGSFLVEEEYELTKACCTRLGIDRFSIGLGEYEVSESTKSMFITISI